MGILLRPGRTGTAGTIGREVQQYLDGKTVHKVVVVVNKLVYLVVK